jgi:hypothetical protein
MSSAAVKGVEAVPEGIRMALDRSVEIGIRMALDRLVEIAAPAAQVWDRAGILRYFTRA